MATWADQLSEDDLNFVKHFLLASGSLKDLARQYNLSYPTVRARIDRLIEKIKLHDAEQPISEFERLLRSKWIEKKLDTDTLHQLLAAHRASAQEPTAGPARAHAPAPVSSDNPAGVDVD